MPRNRLERKANAHAVVVATCSLLMLAFANPASGATVGTTTVEPPFPDPCFVWHEVRYESAPGERNDAQFSFVPSLYEPYPNPFPGPSPECGGVGSAEDTALVTDLTAPLRAQGSGCMSATPRAALCIATAIVRLTITTGDQRDLVKVLALNPPADVTAGPGDDAVNVANGHGGDVVHCGAGKDGATIDGGDRVDADCEKVTRLLP